MTNWFDSTSLKKTSWPVSGHLIQRFSGVSRRLRNDRIFGRTTLEIQFIDSLFVARTGQYSTKAGPGFRTDRAQIRRNYSAATRRTERTPSARAATRLV